MSKLMGKRYEIRVNGEWDKIAEIARATEKLIRTTRLKGFSFQEVNKLEDQILTMYLSPKENESFAEYKSRFIDAFVGDGFKGAMTSLLMRQKVPIKFSFTHNESTLSVDTTTKNRRYEATIHASGIYSQRGASIAEGLKELLEQNQVQHTYKSLDRLI